MLVNLTKDEINVTLKTLKSYHSLHPDDEQIYLKLIDRFENYKKICTCKEDNSNNAY